MAHTNGIAVLEALEPRLLLSGHVVAEAILGASPLGDGGVNEVATVAEVSPSNIPAGEPGEALGLGETGPVSGLPVGQAEAAPLGLPAQSDLLAFDIHEQTLAFEDIERYMLFEDWGGELADAEKSPENAEDDLLMCWAAACSNILEWTGWGRVGGMTGTDEMFDYYKDHWSNGGLVMEYGWEWWFDGTDDSPWLGLLQARVDAPGGGFHPGFEFYDYYHSEDDNSQAMAAIDEFLHSGYGTTLGIRSPVGGGHAITCWGFTYDEDDPAYYKGIWVTDSDDDMDNSAPPDSLQYYQVRYAAEGLQGERWRLVDFHGYDDWFIGDVQALEPMPLALTTEVYVELRSLGGDGREPAAATMPRKGLPTDEQSVAIKDHATLALAGVLPGADVGPAIVAGGLEAATLICDGERTEGLFGDSIPGLLLEAEAHDMLAEAGKADQLFGDEASDPLVSAPPGDLPMGGDVLHGGPGNGVLGASQGNHILRGRADPLPEPLAEWADPTALGSEGPGLPGDASQGAPAVSELGPEGLETDELDIVATLEAPAPLTNSPQKR